MVRICVLTVVALAALPAPAPAQIQRQGQSFGARPEAQRPDNDTRNIVINREKSCETQADAQELAGDTREVFLATCEELREGTQD